MNTADFLAAVLPPEGPYCAQWAYSSSTRPTNVGFYSTLAQLEAKVLELDTQGRTVYFRTASYHSDHRFSAKEANAKERKSFHVDIDVGPNKEYKTRREAANELLRVIGELKLPDPLIVSSGGGFHVYWPFEEPVSITQWQPVANKFRDALRAAGLKFDYGLSVNCVCLLRPVGTHHRKTGKDIPVRVMREGVVSPFRVFAEKFLANTSADQFDAEIAVMFEMDDSLVEDAEYPPSDADQVANECAFIREFRETGYGGGGKQSEWYRALGVVKHCIDGDAKCHEWSTQADNYDQGHCQRKIEQWEKGPTTCQYIADNFDGYCDGCQHNGQITSPVQLGYEQGEIVTVEKQVAEAKPEENTGPWWPKGIGWDSNKRAMYIEKWDPEDGAYREHFSSTMFFVETRIMAEGEWQFLVHRRKYVRSDGAETWDKFTVPTGIVAKPTEMAMEFAKREVYVTPKTGPVNLTEVLKSYGDALRMRRVETRLHNAMGWHVEDTDVSPHDMAYSPQADGFVVGNKLITRTDEKLVMLSDHVRSNWLDGFGRAGTPSEWARGIHEMFVKPDVIPYQFVILACFADALISLFGRSEYHGTLLSLTGQTGFGKTTIVRVGMSIWGNPKLLTLNGTPRGGMTQKAFLKTLSTLRHIGPLLDEVGQQNPNILGELVYAVTMGMSREGLTSERKPMPVEDPWFSITKMTSNKSLLQIVTDDETANEETGDALQKRIFEINFDRLGYDPDKLTGDKEIGLKIQRFPDQQYGTAGVVWIRYLLDHMNESITLLEDTYQEVRKESPSTSERFLDYMEAVVLTAGKLVSKAGLMHPNMEGVKTFIKDVREDMASTRADTKIPVLDAFSRYLSQNYAGIVRTNHFPQGRGRGGTVETPLYEVRGEIIGRVAVKDHMAAFYIAPLREWCRIRNIDFNKMLKEMDDHGFFVHDPKLLTSHKKQAPLKTAVGRHNLARDTPLQSARALCLMVDFGRIAGAPSLRGLTAKDLEDEADEG